MPEPLTRIHLGRRPPMTSGAPVRAMFLLLLAGCVSDANYADKAADVYCETVFACDLDDGRWGFEHQCRDSVAAEGLNWKEQRLEDGCIVDQEAWRPCLDALTDAGCEGIEDADLYCQGAYACE